ncbi:MAG: protein of unknown function, moaD-like [Nitrospira sp.]|jgi:molybdopterin synthase sulfur carrier subunit|nr:protein of unknown function, moaD-like [Nitrospira sp.]
MVKVLILGVTLQQRMSETELDLDVERPMAIKALLDSHPDQLAALAPFVERGELLVTVNRKVGSIDSLVRDGDVLKIAHQSRASYDGTTDIPT